MPSFREESGLEGEEKNWVFPLKEPDFGELEKEGEEDAEVKRVKMSFASLGEMDWPVVWRYTLAWRPARTSFWPLSSNKVTSSFKSEFMRRLSFSDNTAFKRSIWRVCSSPMVYFNTASKSARYISDRF